MIKHDFQGSNFVEIFNPNIKDPLTQFKITGPNGIQKIFDKELKGSVFQLDGNPSTTKLTIPKDTKFGLSLVQRYIVFQINIKENNEFSLEIGISDLSQNRRNLIFSTLQKDLIVQPLNAKIPMKFLNRSWINLVFDLTTLISDIWKNQTLKSIESFSISANCRIRKIFTLNKLSNPQQTPEDALNSMTEFPKSIESITQIFNLNDPKCKHKTDVQSETKAKNVFKIAFGSKLPSNATSHTAASAKKKNQKSQINGENGELVEFTEKNDKAQHSNDLTLPLSSLNTTLPLRRKSESDNQTDSEKMIAPTKTNNIGESLLVAKLAPITQRTPSSYTSKPIKNNSETSSNSTRNLFSSDLSNTVINPDTSSNTTQPNKIPHPPPQSTRPANSSARKLRLSSAVKNNNKPNSTQQTRPSNTAKSNNLVNMHGGESSSNEEDIDFHNNSSKTLIEYSPFKNKIQNSPSKTSSIQPEVINESITDLVQGLKLKNIPNSRKSTHLIQIASNPSEDQSKNSSSNSVYSFYSRPKPAGFNLRNDAIKDSVSSANGLNKVYDFRKYSPSLKSIPRSSHAVSSLNELEVLQNNDGLQLNLDCVQPSTNKKKLTNPLKNSFIKQPQEAACSDTYSGNVKISNDLYDSIDYKKQSVNIPNNNSNDNNKNYMNSTNSTADQNGVLDSFEAKMLSEMKAEMESDSSVQKPTQKNQNQNRLVQRDKMDEQKEEKIKFLKPDLEKSSLNPISPDAEYFENIKQHEASGIQSPFSDDNNPTSEKYNFDAITSSIDDTTTSISKKTPSRKMKTDEFNNYQDEMNVSLQLNVPSKSINLKDLQLNYSPLLNQHQHALNKLQQNAITEEPSHYDDSQADIDDIVSDSDEEVDLLYDPALNCYYDPKTSTYYELNLS